MRVVNKYRVYWDHEKVFKDGTKTLLEAEFKAKGDTDMLKHLKKAEGVSRCFIADSADVLAEGLTLRHAEDQFDRYRGRKFSMRHALKVAGFDKATRKEFWDVFTATWPQSVPVIEVGKVMAFLEKQGVPISVDVFLAEMAQKSKEANAAVGG